MAVYVSETRLHQRGPARARDRGSEGIELLEKAACRIGDSLQPERAHVIEQPRSQRCRVAGVEQVHMRRLVTPGLCAPACYRKKMRWRPTRRHRGRTLCDSCREFWR